MEPKKLNGKNVEQALDAKAGKGEYLPPGLRAATVKCLTETFEATELVPKGSKIALGNLNAGIVPAFVLVEKVGPLRGSIGTLDRPDLFGFIRAETLVMPNEPNKPLMKSGEVFIHLVADYEAGGRIAAKLFYTQ